MKWEVNWLYHRRLGLFFNSIWLDPSTNCKILPKYVERKNAKQIYLQKPPQHGVGMPWTTTKRIRSSAFNANEMKLKEFHLTAKQWVEKKSSTWNDSMNIIKNGHNCIECLPFFALLAINGWIWLERQPGCASSACHLCLRCEMNIFCRMLLLSVEKWKIFFPLLAFGWRWLYNTWKHPSSGQVTFAFPDTVCHKNRMQFKSLAEHHCSHRLSHCVCMFVTVCTLCMLHIN